MSDLDYVAAAIRADLENGAYRDDYQRARKDKGKTAAMGPAELAAHWGRLRDIEKRYTDTEVTLVCFVCDILLNSLLIQLCAGRICCSQTSCR